MEDNMVELRERFIETNGIKIHLMEAGPQDGPIIMFLHGFPEFWYRVIMPLLILWGVDDVNILQEQAEQSLEYCDEARLVKFDCTHWIQHEEPDRVNQMIEEFITQR
jgi:pimeloyl-ACP methyl ester carboxylesterase